MKLAATVITYRPDATVIKNIGTYSSWVETIFVLDNTEENNEAFAQSLIGISNAVYYKYNENMGIGLRLNQAVNKARLAGFTHLLTMDQDSSYEENVFEKYLQKAKAYLQGSSKVGVFAVNHMPLFMPQTSKPQKVLSTITSGSIIDLSIHQKIGGYNEALFLDLVDADYCYRIAAGGYDTILFADIVLTHTIGYFVPGRSFKNFKITPRRIHPPIRIYYLLRNGLYLMHQKDFPEAAKIEIRRSFSLFKNNILYNPRRWQVFKYIIKAYIDSRAGRLGKLKE